MPRLYSANLGGGGGGTPVNDRAGAFTVPISTQTVTVTFTSPVPAATYAIVFSIYNNVDTDPIWLQGVVTSKTLAGFTVLLNAPTDTANYFMDYMVTAYA